MSMTNDELRQAIEDAAKLVRTTASDSPVYHDAVKHMRALLAEQQRRAAVTLAPVVAPVVAPTGPQWVQPVIVTPTWIPQQPWTPPYEITCRTQ